MPPALEQGVTRCNQVPVPPSCLRTRGNKVQVPGEARCSCQGGLEQGQRAAARVPPGSEQGAIRLMPLNQRPVSEIFS